MEKMVKALVYPVMKGIYFIIIDTLTLLLRDETPDKNSNKWD